MEVSTIGREDLNSTITICRSNIREIPTLNCRSVCLPEACPIDLRVAGLGAE